MKEIFGDYYFFCKSIVMSKSWIRIFFLCLVLLASACSSKKVIGPDGQEISEEDLAAQTASRFGEGEIPTAEGEGPFRDIHFGYDSSSIDDFGRQDIEYNVQLLSDSYSDLKVQLEGHCDERGTAEYNLALGNQRAKSIYDALIAGGISADRISTISYGEELPLVTGSSEEAWSKNRRVHFAPMKKE